MVALEITKSDLNLYISYSLKSSLIDLFNIYMKKLEVIFDLRSILFFEIF